MPEQNTKTYWKSLAERDAQPGPKACRMPAPMPEGGVFEDGVANGAGQPGAGRHRTAHGPRGAFLKLARPRRGRGGPGRLRQGGGKGLALPGSARGGHPRGERLLRLGLRRLQRPAAAPWARPATPDPSNWKATPATRSTRARSAPRARPRCLAFYDERRLKGPQIDGKEASWDDLDQGLRADLAKLKGDKIRVLSKTILSPTLHGQIQAVLIRPSRLQACGLRCPVLVGYPGRPCPDPRAPVRCPITNWTRPT